MPNEEEYDNEEILDEEVEDEQTSEELDAEDDDQEVESPDEEQTSEESEDDEEPLDYDEFAEVSYVKDGKEYRKLVDPDVADAIRMAERDRLNQELRGKTRNADVPRSELTDVVGQWVKSGYSDSAIMGAIAEYWLQNNQGNAQEKEESLPEDATPEEEIQFLVNRELKPLKKELEETKRLLRERQKAESEQETWDYNNALFMAEFEARGIEPEFSEHSSAILRSAVRHLYGGIQLNEVKLNQHQIRAIINEFRDRMIEEYDEEPEVRNPYKSAKVVYAKTPSRQSRKSQAPIIQKATKKAPTIISGRTAKGNQMQTGYQSEKPKTPRQVNDFYLQL